MRLWPLVSDDHSQWGERVASWIKREWIDAWIEGVPVPTIEEALAGLTDPTRSQPLPSGSPGRSCG